jgi:hypothetical protein
VATAAPATALAQIATDRPGFGDGSAVVTDQTIQVEMGYALGVNGRTTHELGQLLLRYGLRDFLELRGGIGSYVFSEGSDGYSGTNVGAKVRLWRSSLARLSGVASTSLPTGTGPFDSGDDRVRQDLRLAFDGALGANLALSINGGLRFFYTDTAETEWLFIPTLSTSLNQRTGFYVGYAGFYRENTDGNWVQAGLTYLTNPDTQLDVSTGLRLDEESNRAFFGIGFSHRF